MADHQDAVPETDETNNTRMAPGRIRVK